MSRHTSKAGKLCHGKVTQLGTNPWWTAGNVNSPITCFECPDNNAYPKTELHKALIKMFNPLLSLQMAWADNKLTNSFWYIIHDLFSFSGNFLFLSKKKKQTSQKTSQKPPIKYKKKQQLLQNNLESKTSSISFMACLLDLKHYNVGNVWQLLCRTRAPEWPLEKEAAGLGLLGFSFQGPTSHWTPCLHNLSYAGKLNCPANIYWQRHKLMIQGLDTW